MYTLTLYKIIPLAIVSLVSVFCLLLLLEAVCFFHILHRNTPAVYSDVIVVFEGNSERIRSGYQLVDRGYAPALVITPANSRKLERYDGIYQPSRGYERIVEDQARTTFENALFSSKIVKENGFKTVILVTSWDHMPRSYLLFKMMLFGSGVQILPHFVATGKLNRENWYRHAVGWKMIYNQLLEYWGSMFECIKFLCNGDRTDIVPGKSGFLVGLKKILLFDIDSKSLKR